MSRQEKCLEKINDKIIDLESSDDRMIKKIELKKPKELKIMKINTKEQLEEIESEFVILKENERMARFKIEQIK